MKPQGPNGWVRAFDSQISGSRADARDNVEFSIMKSSFASDSRVAVVQLPTFLFREPGATCLIRKLSSSRNFSARSRLRQRVAILFSGTTYAFTSVFRVKVPISRVANTNFSLPRGGDKSNSVFCRTSKSLTWRNFVPGGCRCSFRTNQTSQRRLASASCRLVLFPLILLTLTASLVPYY
ncbi:hypothetical protein C8F01DRAFT_591867 [Mycena amicta]|nr:hypothetical protein C8F01DRAFT_591867 [Mycena amicta]